MLKIQNEVLQLYLMYLKYFLPLTCLFGIIDGEILSKSLI